jgi:hypothetical protein
MAVFEFRSQKLGLDIAGHHFDVEVADDLPEKVKALSEESGKLLAEIGSTTTEDALIFCGKAIDAILGNGAFQKIFTDRAPNLRDASDVIVFLTGEVGKLYKEK